MGFFKIIPIVQKTFQTYKKIHVPNDYIQSQHHFLGVHVSNKILKNLMYVYEIRSSIDIASIV